MPFSRGWGVFLKTQGLGHLEMSWYNKLVEPNLIHLAIKKFSSRSSFEAWTEEQHMEGQVGASRGPRGPGRNTGGGSGLRETLWLCLQDPRAPCLRPPSPADFRVPPEPEAEDPQRCISQRAPGGWSQRALGLNVNTAPCYALGKVSSLSPSGLLCKEGQI